MAGLVSLPISSSHILSPSDCLQTMSSDRIVIGYNTGVENGESSGSALVQSPEVESLRLAPMAVTQIPHDIDGCCDSEEAAADQNQLVHLEHRILQTATLASRIPSASENQRPTRVIPRTLGHSNASARQEPSATGQNVRAFAFVEMRTSNGRRDWNAKSKIRSHAQKIVQATRRQRRNLFKENAIFSRLTGSAYHTPLSRHGYEKKANWGGLLQPRHRYDDQPRPAVANSPFHRNEKNYQLPRWRRNPLRRYQLSPVRKTADNLQRDNGGFQLLGKAISLSTFWTGAIRSFQSNSLSCQSTHI